MRRSLSLSPSLRAIFLPAVFLQAVIPQMERTAHRPFQHARRGHDARSGNAVFGQAAALLVTLILLSDLACTRAFAAPFITVASTTSTQNSGLYAHLLPQFEQASGITVRVVALGTGAALRLARSGDADVLLVHHQASEEDFVREGFGVERHRLMYNDFVLVGPTEDPAMAHSAGSIGAAFTRIHHAQAVFASRGDDSGTHRRELALWATTGRDPTIASGTWYRELGAGMGATLNTAAAMGAYALTDRATWLSFRNRRSLRLLFEGGANLRNEYSVILVSAKRHPHAKAQLGQRFIDWLLSPAGQGAIGSFRLEGQQVFFPDAQVR